MVCVRGAGRAWASAAFMACTRDLGWQRWLVAGRAREMFSAEKEQAWKKRKAEHSEKNVKSEAATGAQVPENVEGDLARRMARLELLVGLHDETIRDLQAWTTATWLLGEESAVGKQLLSAMEEWKKERPEKGPHPGGPPRQALGYAIQEIIGAREGFTVFREHMINEVREPARISEVSLQFGVCKETRDKKVLLQLRPAQGVLAKWTEVFSFLDAEAEKTGGGRKLDKAPPGAEARTLRAMAKARGKAKAKAKGGAA